MPRILTALALILCLLCPAALSEVAGVDGELTLEDATAFAMAFFSKTCLENTDSLTITPVQYGDLWAVYGENSTDGARHILKFDRNLRINLYLNLNWNTPDIVPADQLPAFDDPDEAAMALDELLQDVRGYGAETICALGKAEDDNVWVLSPDDFLGDSEHMMESYALVRIPESGPWYLLGYGDLNTNGAFYGDYMSRGDAVAIAKERAAELEGMDPAQITVRYTRFLYRREVVGEGETLFAPTYWEVTLEADGLGEDPYNDFVDPVFEDDGSGDDKTGWVEVLIDALTGEVLDVLQGSELGNG